MKWVAYPSVIPEQTKSHGTRPRPETQIPRHGPSMPGDSRLGVRGGSGRLFLLRRWIAQTHLLILHRFDILILPIILDHFVREQWAFGDEVIVNV